MVRIEFENRKDFIDAAAGMADFACVSVEEYIYSTSVVVYVENTLGDIFQYTYGIYDNKEKAEKAARDAVRWIKRNLKKVPVYRCRPVHRRCGVDD